VAAGQGNTVPTTPTKRESDTSQLGAANPATTSKSSEPPVPLHIANELRDAQATIGGLNAKMAELKKENKVLVAGAIGATAGGVADAAAASAAAEAAKQAAIKAYMVQRYATWISAKVVDATAYAQTAGAAAAVAAEAGAAAAVAAEAVVAAEATEAIALAAAAEAGHAAALASSTAGQATAVTQITREVAAGAATAASMSLVLPLAIIAGVAAAVLCYWYC
jgi:hypothetical protein